MAPPPRIEPATWELTSGEFEIESATDEPPIHQRPDADPAYHDAMRYGAEPDIADVPFELSRPSIETASS